MYVFPFKPTTIKHQPRSPFSTVEFDPGCEAMIYTTDGTPLQGYPSSLFLIEKMTKMHRTQGITGGYGGDRRVEYIIPASVVKAGKYDFVIESSCNGMFGVPWNGDTIAPPDVRFYPPPLLCVVFFYS